jgi:dinuclear metal center YbgI/SA1388 family protein
MNKKDFMITKKMLIKDVIQKLTEIAPNKLAYDWDNVGMQIGDKEREVRKILLTLDVTQNAIEKAVKNKVDLIISHHPFIFRSLKTITQPGILKLIENKIAVFCAHTNLDVAKNGVNQVLAEKLNLQNCEVISAETELSHVAVYVPENAVIKVKEAIFAAGAGIIGEYEKCANEYEVQGQFLPSEKSNPVVGEKEVLNTVPEIKLEFFIEAIFLNQVISAIKKSHPYETPVYAVYPQKQKSSNFGLGLFGDLEKSISLQEFAEFTKKQLQCPYLTLWKADKNADELIQKIAVCGGSGSSLLGKVTGKADVFVSADFTYHTILESKIPLIDAGHFYTEFPVLDLLEKHLSDFPVEILRLSVAEHEISNLVKI